MLGTAVRASKVLTHLQQVYEAGLKPVSVVSMGAVV